MKLTATLEKTIIILNPVKMAPQGRSATKTSDKSVLKGLVTKFWSHTEKMGETNTKSFEGLL